MSCFKADCDRCDLPHGYCVSINQTIKDERLDEIFRGNINEQVKDLTNCDWNENEQEFRKSTHTQNRTQKKTLQQLRQIQEQWMEVASNKKRFGQISFSIYRYDCETLCHFCFEWRVNKKTKMFFGKLYNIYGIKSVN